MRIEWLTVFAENQGHQGQIVASPVAVKRYFVPCSIMQLGTTRDRRKMGGILDSISKKHLRAEEKRNGDSVRASGADPSLSTPCMCGCHIVWQDVYGGPSGPWRCFACQPPPSESLVARWGDGRESEYPEEAEFERRWIVYVIDGREIMQRRDLRTPIPRRAVVLQG